MRIIKEKTQYHLYALESEYNKTLVEFCQYLKATLGWQEFQWDHVNKKWRFKDPTIVRMIKEKFSFLAYDEQIERDMVVADLINDTERRREEYAKVIKEKEVSDLKKVDGIKGELYEYQKLGVEFLVNSGGRALLADAPGVGKTAQALGYVAHSGHKRTLIVCPASVKFSWESEIKKWTSLKSFIVGPKTDLKDIPFDANCIIINFDILKKFYNEFMKYQWDCLVGDEIHMIKSSTAIRTKVFKALAKDIPNVIMLTGTPVLSRPIEIFNVLNIIDPKTWSNYYNYATKYCGGKQGYWGFEAKGATNLSELRARIEKYFLRRTKDEVLKELPPKNFSDVEIDLPDEEREQYDLAEENLVEYMRTYKTQKTDKEIAKSLQGEKLVKLNLLREINAMGKISAAREIIDSIVDAGEKVLVFSNFNGPIKELYDIYEDNSVMILGETPVDERGELVKKFQEDPNVQIFFGGIKSAGVGITLTAASNIIEIDLPWNPADLEQAENRAHRPGAEYQSLNIYKIISRDTIDEFMLKLLQHKQLIINKLIEGDEEKEEKNLVNEYIKSLEEKRKIK